MSKQFVHRQESRSEKAPFLEISSFCLLIFPEAMGGRAGNKGKESKCPGVCAGEPPLPLAGDMEMHKAVIFFFFF